jgi:hypothetical protein
MHDSPVAREMRHQIVKLVSEGKSEEDRRSLRGALGGADSAAALRKSMDLVECTSDRRAAGAVCVLLLLGRARKPTGDAIVSIGGLRVMLLKEE